MPTAVPSKAPPLWSTSMPRSRAALYLWECDDNDAAVARLRDFAQSRGDDIVVRYLERRSHGDRRPRLKQLLTSAGRSHFDVVYVETVDALGVSPASVLGVARRLVALSVRLVSATEPWFDLNSPSLVWVAGAETRRLRRAAESREAKRRQGERTGELPIGSRLAADGVGVETDEREQEAIREACRLREERQPLRRIADVLTSAGYRSRAGTPLTHRQISRILARANT